MRPDRDKYYRIASVFKNCAIIATDIDTATIWKSFFHSMVIEYPMKLIFQKQI